MKKMKKKAKARLLCTISIVLIIFCALAVRIVRTTSDDLSLAQEHQYEISIYAAQFADASQYLTDEVRGYAATSDKVHYDNYWREVNEDKNRDKSVKLMKEIGLSDEEIDMVEHIMELSNELVPLEEESMEYVKKGNAQKAFNILYSDEYVEGVTKISKQIEEFEKSIEVRMADKVKEASASADFFATATTIAVIITLIMQIVLIMFILKELIDPIIKIQNKMIDLAEGDIKTQFYIQQDTTEIGLTAKAVHDFQQFQNDIIEDIDYLLSEMAEGNFDLRTRCEEKYKGDYKNILMSMRKLNRRLNGTLVEINTSADQVNCGADQIACVAQALSQGATEQAASVEELSATISNVSGHIKEIAENAKVAKEHSAETERTVGECSVKMDAMNNAMKDIGEKSEEISKIIKTIDDIAFQTNILALNAAVEAARAGAAGKGFAVVADEVRNLASKSADAANETTQLIEHTVTSVANGKNIASETFEILKEVVNKSSDVGDAVVRISNATDKQAAAIDEVAIGMEQINDVVQTNSATAEESAAASEELSGQSEMLKSLVGTFTFRKD